MYFNFQGSPPGSREQNVSTQSGDGLWPDPATTGSDYREAAQGWSGDEHGGRDGTGGHPVLFPASEVKVGRRRRENV